MCKNLKEIKLVVVFFFIAALSYGCVSLQHETGAPIRTENINKLATGKSTKSDVIELFGMPAVKMGIGMPNMDTTGIQSAIITSGDDNIYVYKRCKTSTSSKVDPTIFIPFAGAVLAEGHGVTEEKCEQLTIMLDKNNIVKSYSYHADDPINENNISKLVKDKSTKTGVIELFGAPNILTPSDNDEVYTYKKCMTLSKGGSLFRVDYSSREICKQLTIMLDRNTELLKTYFYQPFPKK